LLVAWASNAGAAAPTSGSQSQAAQTNPAAKISSKLRAQFSADADGRVRYLVVLNEQADLTNNIRDWQAKGRYVFDKLVQTANATQPQVAASLQTQQAAGNVDRFKSYYIINAFQVVGNLASAENLAALSEVGHVVVFPVVTLDEPVMRVDDVKPPSLKEWNVDLVNAPQAWALGYDGTGVTVGSLDTGTRWTHEALKTRYRGWNGTTADHNFNWWDPVSGQPAPYDGDGHGTHTMGTILGIDVEPPANADIHIGVAPGAKWISSNGIADGAGNADIIEAGEFMLAPWDLNKQNANPDLRPVVVSNSWGFGVSTPLCPGGDPIDGEFFRDIVKAWVAAGIFPSFSAGNDFPHGNRIPAAYPETFETGALSRYNLKASYSSEGPSCFDLGQHPQIMAGGGDDGPGLEEDLVRSSYNTSDTTYEYLAGTSMAQPATAGAVAILKQVNPNLTIQETWYILTSTASFDPSWGVRPNPLYGWGKLQIDQAVLAARAMVPPTVTGTPPTATQTNTPTVTRTPTNTVEPTATPACAVSYNSTDVNKPILDMVPVQSTLVITNGQIIADLDVININISHTWASDLVASLRSPSGTEVELFSAVCGDNDWTAQNTGFTLSDQSNILLCDVIPPNQGTYKPENPLAAFNGQSSTGTWTLTITDTQALATGNLNAWGLRIGSNSPCGPGPTSTPTLTGTPPTATQTLTSTATSVVSNTLTPSAIPSLTSTATTVSATSTVSSTAVNTVVSTPTLTRTSTPTSTSSSTRTATGTAVPSSTRTSTSIATTTTTATSVPTACTIQFQDVPPSSEVSSFYPFVRCLACRGVLGGYPCGGANSQTGQPEPCGATGNPYFRPNNNITRGQIAKIVANAAGLDEEVQGQTYADVQPSDDPSSFYVYIERLTAHNVMGGYPCDTTEGTEGEPCDGQNRAYFRPSSYATRAQLAKIVSNAAGYVDNVEGQTFADVPPPAEENDPSSFYLYVERLAKRGVIGGYPCGGSAAGEGEECDEQNRPYFRPSSQVTRAQAAKIVANTFYPNCQTPARR
jgi:subtilisin family serine protease